jgi:transcriptional regulator with XRE-family HTH domain
LRAELGLSQERLAVEMDVSRQTINSIETERYTPTKEELAQHSPRDTWTVDLAVERAEPDGPTPSNR